MPAPLSTPDGVLRVEFEPAQARDNSAEHSADNTQPGAPRVIHIPSKRIVFDRFGSSCVAKATIDPKGRLNLTLLGRDRSVPEELLVFDPAHDRCIRYAMPTGERPATWWSLGISTEPKLGQTPQSRAFQGQALQGQAGTPDQRTLGPSTPADLAPPATPSPDSSIFIEVTPDLARASRLGMRRPKPIDPADVIEPVPPLPASATPHSLSLARSLIGLAVISITAASCVFAIAWLLATQTPIRKLPSWAGWGLSMFGASLITWTGVSALAATNILRARRTTPKPR